MWGSQIVSDGSFPGIVRKIRLAYLVVCGQALFWKIPIIISAWGYPGIPPFPSVTSTAAAKQYRALDRSCTEHFTAFNLVSFVFKVLMMYFLHFLKRNVSKLIDSGGL